MFISRKYNANAPVANANGIGNNKTKPARKEPKLNTNIKKMIPTVTR